MTVKVCAQPGCPELSEQTYCTTHTSPAWQTSTRRERTVSGWEQQRRAKRILLRDHCICHVCHTGAADQVDHVIPLSEGGADTDSNLAAIHAEPCHREKTQAEAARAKSPT